MNNCGLLVSFLIGMICIMLYFRYKTITSLGVIFSGIWFIITFLASFELYGMRPINNSTFAMILAGVVCFTFGYILCNRMPVIVFGNTKEMISKKLLVGISLITIFFYIYLSVRVLGLITKGNSYVIIRNMYQGYSDTSTYLSKTEYLLNSLIFGPITKVIFIITSILYAKDSKEWKLWVLTAISNILYAFSTASRFTILSVIISIILIYLIFNHELNLKVKRNIKLLFLISVTLIIVVTVVRGYQSESVFSKIVKSLYIYLASAVPMFDNKWSCFDGNFLHGQLFVYGITDFLDSIISIIAGKDVNFSYAAQTVVSDTERFVKIYDNQYFNAYVSIYYYFYVDFGILGIVAGDLLFGLMCAGAEKRMRRRGLVRDVSLYILLAYFIVMSFVRWPFAMLSNCMCVIYIFLFLHKFKFSAK